MSEATDPITRLNAAFEGRYRLEREIGECGVASVYQAEDSVGACRRVETATVTW